ncbi:hypothetical protein ZOD2009_06249 [Haladaptatus paucihalophilus DX253]|uniref:Uncharacterized protein n=1 Tax=Haladaptatus paucihalophilus DX253 TaxID=797209 RepID=E7QR27_HALPU|nr:hypothetical protein ZOD2009_06249 [Haladaptatus paucihalophilus DX253]
MVSVSTVAPLTITSTLVNTMPFPYGSTVFPRMGPTSALPRFPVTVSS